MKTFKCDVCEISTKQYELTELRKEYVVDGINDVCQDCYDQILSANSKIEKALSEVKSSWIKKIILKMKNK